MKDKYFGPIISALISAIMVFILFYLTLYGGLRDRITIVEKRVENEIGEVKKSIIELARDMKLDIGKYKDLLAELRDIRDTRSQIVKTLHDISLIGKYRYVSDTLQKTKETDIQHIKGMELDIKVVRISPSNDQKFQAIINYKSSDTTLPNLAYTISSPEEFKVTWDKINSIEGTKLISNPKIITFNKESATISILESKEYAELSLCLEIIPNIRDGGYVSLDIRPRVTAVSNWTESKKPVISTGEAIAEIVVKEGETIILGGLVQEEKIRAIEKVPVLGDVPLLGSLFRKISSENKESDLLIFITPRIIPYSQLITPSFIENPDVKIGEVVIEDI